MTLTVLITGANRGIGLGLTEKFLREGHTVIAATRNPDGSRELWEIESHYKSKFSIVELDVTDEASLRAAERHLKDKPIDILINNAGVAPESRAPFSEVHRSSVAKALQVNAIGPLVTTQTFLPNLGKGHRKVVATISSKMGSISDNQTGGAYAYRMSKAAVNMFTRSLAADHPDLCAVVLHPGWVQTDMGGTGAPLTVGHSVNGLYHVIVNLKKEHTGRFFDYEGKEIAW